MLQRLFHSGPYTWHRDGPTIRMNKSKCTWLIIYAACIWFTIRVLYIPVVTIHGAIFGITRNQFAVYLMLGQFYMAVGFFQLNMFLNVGEIKGFVNCMLHFSRKAAGEQTRKATAIYFFQALKQSAGLLELPDHLMRQILQFLAVDLTRKKHPVKNDGCSKFMWIMITFSMLNPPDEHSKSQRYCQLMANIA